MNETASGLGEQRVLAYAVGDFAERNRRIMRIFYLNKTRDIGWQLSPSDVQRRMLADFGWEIDLDSLENALNTLAKNGNLLDQANTRDAASPAEWRRRRLLYDITPAGEKVERTLQELDALRDSAAVLDSWRLASIRDALRRLARALETSDPDAKAVSDDLERVTTSVRKLSDGATDFMSRLHSFTVSETIDPDAFVAHQDAVIEHLQDFHQALKRSTDDIRTALAAVERQGVERLIELALSVRDAPVAMPGDDPEAVAKQPMLDELAHWRGVCNWFGVGDSADSAPWEVISRRLVDAIHGIVDIADRLIGRAADKRDRTTAWQHLARIVAEADEQTATAAFAVAVGQRPARHFSGTFEDPGQVVAPGGRSWVDAPAAPVAAHLRKPGSRAPGAGTPARLVRNDRLRDRVRREREEEARHLARLTERLQAGATLRMSELHALHPLELRYMLGWISRAFTQPRRADGSRQVTSADRSKTLRLVPPGDGTRCRVQVDTGELDCPDYRLEVIK